MARHESEGLDRFAREHHLAYAVEQEAPAATGPAATTYDLQLFATHGEDRLEAPGCPRCVELTVELRSFAATLVAEAGAESSAEILEPPPVIYSTRPNAPDEVSLVVRVAEERSRQPPGAGGGLQRIEDRLKTLGVPRR